ncbi:MAG: response regulator [Bacteroidales bacterium]|nr:response regulator [Bacteroidales bacterium]
MNTVFYSTTSGQTANGISSDFKLKFEQIDIRQGLSSNAVYCILQDRKGFIWFGTEDGLNKYDGYKFTVFTVGYEGDKFVSNTRINALFEDKHGYIWLGTDGGGLNRYDPGKEIFTHYFANPNDPNSLSDNKVTSICEDQDGILWVGTANGLDRVGADNDKESLYFQNNKHDPDNPNSLNNNRIFCLFVDHENNLWIGTEEGGLNLLTPENRSINNPIFLHFNANPNIPFSLSNNAVVTISEDMNRTLWIGTMDGLNKVIRYGDNDSLKFINYKHDPNDPNSLSNNKVYSILEDQTGNIWIGTIGGGLNRMLHDTTNDPNEYRFITYKYDPLNTASIFTDAVFALYESRSGIIWFATNNAGIGKIDPKITKFRQYKHNPNNQNSLSNNVVKAIHEDKTGNIWLGSWGGGLSSFNPETGTNKHYRLEWNNPKTISHDIVQTICEDYKGRLWIGTIGGGLNMFDPKTESFTIYKHRYGDKNSLISNDIWRLVASHDKSAIWIGTYEGLDKFDMETGRFTHFVNDLNDQNSLSFNDIRTLYEDEAGTLWVGTAGGGLNKLINSTGDIPFKFITYINDPDNPESLSNNSVFSIYKDSSDILWIGTLGGGLNKFDTKTEIFTHYRKSDGLANDVIKGMLKDNNGFLWISTTNGLSKFDTKTGEFNNYTVNDGLQDNIFNLGSCCKTKNGELFFGGVNGVNAFYPGLIKDNPFIPPVFITDFKIFNQSILVGQELDGKIILDKAIDETKEIYLKYKHKVISFEFSALSYTSPEKNQFAYTLEGVDESWNYTDYKGRSVTYSNLSPGTYTFKVKASNNDRIWNNEGTSLKIIIVPPLWKTPWAFLIYILAIIILLLFYRKFVLNRIRLRNELEYEREQHKRRMEINQEKLRFFTNISHEFRTPLTLLLGLLQKLIFSDGKMSATERRQQYRVMDRNANILLRLIEQLMDFRKAESEKMKLSAREGNIIKNLKEIAELFNTIAEQRKINFRFNSNLDTLATWYDPDKLENIFFNLLSNAFKYTPVHGKIELSVTMCCPEENARLSISCDLVKEEGSITDFLSIEVKDTGKGISEEHIDRIFERFYQVDDPKQLHYAGTGIGLAFTKKLVDLFHGEITVSSKEGKGTSFYVKLPVGKEYLTKEEILDDTRIVVPDASGGYALMENQIPDDFSEEIKKPKKKKGIKTTGPLILIIEDHDELRSYLRDFFNDKYRVMIAADGYEGLDITNRKNPDCVITDVMMPEMDGIEFCRKLKTNVHISHIPVIMLTARTAMEHRLEGLNIGADAYLTKPFQINHLEALVKNLLESRKKLRQKFSLDSAINPKEITITPVDEKFMQKAIDVVEKFMSDPDLDIDTFASEMGESRIQLYRKIKALTDLAPNEFVRNLRLKRAAQLLIHEKSTVGEVLYKVGFNNRSYFNRCFRQQFGSSPGDYVKNYKEA